MPERRIRQVNREVRTWIEDRLARAQDRSDAHHREYLRKIGKLKRDGIDEK